MMRKPKDINNLRQCVRRVRGDILWIFCVECDEWHQAAIQARCNVTFKQVTAPVIEDADQYTFACSACGCDIGYLLDDITRQWLVKKMNMPRGA
jgi:hypothetical protein